MSSGQAKCAEEAEDRHLDSIHKKFQKVAKTEHKGRLAYNIQQVNDNLEKSKKIVDKVPLSSSDRWNLEQLFDSVERIIGNKELK